MAERDPAFLYYDGDVALDVQHMNRQERGCYFDLVQMYRRYRGYTMEQLRKILGTDMESCWNALELVLVLDDVTGKYHIPWLRLALAKRAQSSETQRERIKKYWDGVRKADAEAIAKGQPMVKRRKKSGNTVVLPRNNIGNTTDIPLENENENTDRIDEDIGGMGEKGEGREESPNWHVMPGEDQLHLELPAIKAASARQLMILTGNRATEAQVLKLWEIFKVQNFTGKKFYSSPDEAYSHFINWAKSQKVNENASKSISYNGKSAGTIELINQLGSDLAAGGTTDFPR